MTPRLSLQLACWVVLTSCAASNVDTSGLPADTEDSPLWCNQGSSESDGGPNDWRSLKKDAFHVVKSDLQSEAIGALSRGPFIELKIEAAARYLRANESLRDGRFIYLVRAAAPNLDVDYTPICKACGPRIDMDVSYSPSRKHLTVSSYSLGNPTPQNFAIVVEAPDAIESVEGHCLSAM